LNLLTVHSRINGYGLKLPIAASAGQSQESYGQEEESPEPVHGDLLYAHINPQERKKLLNRSGFGPIRRGLRSVDTG
jgi:hypothetical protein